MAVAARLPCDPLNGFAMAPRGLFDLPPAGSMALELANWNVLDLGTTMACSFMLCSSKRCTCFCADPLPKLCASYGLDKNGSLFAMDEARRRHKIYCTVSLI